HTKPRFPELPLSQTFSMVGAILRSSRWNAVSVKRESRKRLATGTPGGFLPDDPTSWVRRAALSRCCSNLIQECFSDAFSLCDPFDDQHQTSLPQRTGDPPAPSGASELHGTQAGARQVLQAQYTFTLQSPFRIRFQWPLVIAPRISGAEAGAAQADQFGRRLTAYQQ